MTEEVKSFDYIFEELNDMANFKNFGESKEEEMNSKCEYYEQCQCNCDGADDKTECCECYRLHEHIDMLVDAINQGTKKFHNGEADFYTKQ